MRLCGDKQLKITLLILATAMLLLAPKPVAPHVQSYKQFSTIESEYTCMIKALYFEARGESTTGIIGVANVILNRTKHKKFPSNVCNVVHQRSKYTCQFSWVCDNPRFDINKVPKKLREVAYTAIHGKLKDITNGALFFHSLTTNPWDELIHTRTIGSHNFYR